ncbi:MAG: thiaminase II [Bryobacterales bacterium]|nr:thiaminase II [Bryobacterales bacterium]
MRVLAVLLLAAGTAAASEPLTRQMWRSIEPVYAKTLDHPFLRGLTAGDLPRAKFSFYLIQDAHYLRAFGQALNILASKAPREEWAITLGKHAGEALATERALHESILGEYGVRPEAVRGTRMAPSNYAYVNHLLATALHKPFAHGLAAVLPCYWIYWEVGKEMQKRGSREPAYQKWIDQYAAEDYGATVREVLAMMDAEGARLDAGARTEAMNLFETSARYEWMFWDMAWREERWAP